MGVEFGAERVAAQHCNGARVTLERDSKRPRRDGYRDERVEQHRVVRQLGFEPRMCIDEPFQRVARLSRFRRP